MSSLLNHININSRGGNKTRKKQNKKKRHRRKRASTLNTKINISSSRSKKLTKYSMSPSKINYGFLLLTTHGAHNSDLPTFKLPST